MAFFRQDSWYAAMNPRIKPGSLQQGLSLCTRGSQLSYQGTRLITQPVLLPVSSRIKRLLLRLSSSILWTVSRYLMLSKWVPRMCTWNKKNFNKNILMNYSSFLYQGGDDTFSVALTPRNLKLFSSTESRQRCVSDSFFLKTNNPFIGFVNVCCRLVSVHHPARLLISSRYEPSLFFKFCPITML